MIKKLLSILLACILVLGTFGVFGVTTPVLAANTETLRPDGIGDYTNIGDGDEYHQLPAEGEHWDKVDEAEADNGTTLVRTKNVNEERDAYTLSNSTETGTINSVEVFFRVYGGANKYARPLLVLAGVTTLGTLIEIPTPGWLLFSEVLSRPGGGDWTWADINNLQGGIGLAGTGTVYVACTQVYVVVDYTTAPAVTTNAATYVAQTSARLNSTVDADGGEACDIRFGYGDETQTVANFELYDTKTTWVENTYTTGQHPYLDIASLTANHGYFYRAQIRNNHSTVTSIGEIEFTTEAGVAVPANLKAFPTSTTVGLTWTKGVGATNTMLRYSEVGYPADETEGTQAYLGPLASYIITSLTAGHTYYIVAISNSGAVYSATVEVLATTTAGGAVGEEPTDPTMPTGWFQSPDYTGLSGLPLYAQMNDLFDAFELPRASGWFFSAILGCVVIGAVVFVISRHPTPAVITLAVAMAIASLIKLLPLYMMAFSVVFIIGVWQLGRES